MVISQAVSLAGRPGGGGAGQDNICLLIWEFDRIALREWLDLPIFVPRMRRVKSSGLQFADEGRKNAWLAVCAQVLWERQNALLTTRQRESNTGYV